jgi:hypothetical protein
MRAQWLADLESLEAISQDADARRLLLSMAHISGTGGLQPFLRELAADADLDDETKGTFAELACDATFLHAVEDYVHRTQWLH